MKKYHGELRQIVSDELLDLFGFLSSALKGKNKRWGYWHLTYKPSLYMINGEKHWDFLGEVFRKVNL